MSPGAASAPGDHGELTAGARSPRRVTDLRALLLRGPMLAVDGLRD